jgi:hypothetical protein
MAVLMAHGIHGDFEKATATYPKDFEKATATYPKDANGEDMSLKPFAKTAKKCAKQLNVVLKASATAQSKGAAKVMSSEATVMVAGSVATKTDIV